MFKKLKIQNYILIDKVEIEFTDKLNVITGETGAGKSILLGAISLISGHRAESSVLKDKTKKCVIEAEVLISNKQLKAFFIANDLDFEKETVIRREINPNGKSRAFINDSPVILKTLEQFSSLVFDLHTQDQNRLLKDDGFRLELVDIIANSKVELETYKGFLKSYSSLDSEIKKILFDQNKLQKELDFIQFQHTQLDEANLTAKEQDELELELDKLDHAEEIKQTLGQVYKFISEDEQSIISSLITVENELSKLSSVYPSIQNYLERIHSNLIDLQDLAPDIEKDAQDIEHSPERIEEINERLNILMGLQQKHRVNSVAELIEIRDNLSEKLSNFSTSELDIEVKKKDLIQVRKNLESASSALSKKRLSAFKKIEGQTIQTISKLGIDKARFVIKNQVLDVFGENGQDEIDFFFSANKGTELDNLTKIASGGEISRLMLSVKNLLSQSTNLSTLILDEIDTGISGEVANKMGKLMQKMSTNRQLIVITHLPQIAAKGDLHLKVQKKELEKSIITIVKALSAEERLNEIAQLLSGESVTPAALENAKELIN